jgi:MFS family permease
MTKIDRLFFWIVGALMITDFIGSLEVSMIFGALPAVNRLYGDPGTVGWLITGFVLVQAAAAAVGGRLGDMYGRKRLLEVVLLVSAAGSILSTLSHDLIVIIVGRCLQGVSGAILPLSFGIIRSHATQERASFGTGIVLGAYAVSGGLGFIVGGYFADIGHWNWIFYVSAVLPAVAVVVNRLLIPGDKPDSQRSQNLDWIGAVGLVLAVAAVLIGISLSHSFGWTSPVTLGLILGGFVLLAAWARFELGLENPLINLRRLRDRRILFSIFSFFMIGVGGQQMALVTLSLMQQPLWTGVGLGLTGALAGVAKLPSNLAGVLAGPVGGRLAQLRGGRTAGIVGAAILTLAWVILFITHASLTLVIACAAASTVGLTIMYVATPAVLMEAVPEEETGQATGFAYLVRSLGMAAGAQIVSLLLGSSLLHDSAHHIFSAPLAFERAIGFVAVASIAALCLAIAVPKQRTAVRHP